jgi:hypothetical protein
MKAVIETTAGVRLHVSFGDEQHEFMNGRSSNRLAEPPSTAAAA